MVRGRGDAMNTESKATFPHTHFSWLNPHRENGEEKIFRLKYSNIEDRRAEHHQEYVISVVISL